MYEGAILITALAIASFALSGGCPLITRVVEKLPQMSRKAKGHVKLGVVVCVALLMTTASLAYADTLVVQGNPDYQNMAINNGMPVFLEVSTENTTGSGSVTIDDNGKITVFAKAGNCSSSSVAISRTLQEDLCMTALLG